MIPIVNKLTHKSLNQGPVSIRGFDGLNFNLELKLTVLKIKEIDFIPFYLILSHAKCEPFIVNQGHWVDLTGPVPYTLQSKEGGPDDKRIEG